MFMLMFMLRRMRMHQSSQCQAARRGDQSGHDGQVVNGRHLIERRRLCLDRHGAAVCPAQLGLGLAHGSNGLIELSTEPRWPLR